MVLVKCLGILWCFNLTEIWRCDKISCIMLGDFICLFDSQTMNLDVGKVLIKFVVFSLYWLPYVLFHTLGLGMKKDHVLNKFCPKYLFYCLGFGINNHDC